MTINWGSLLDVSLVSLISTVAVVALVTLGLLGLSRTASAGRVDARAEAPFSRYGRTAFAVLSLAAAAAIVLLGL